jgi:hypothetical protein
MWEGREGIFPLLRKEVNYCTRMGKKDHPNVPNVSKLLHTGSANLLSRWMYHRLEVRERKSASIDIWPGYDHVWIDSGAEVSQRVFE